MDSSLVGSGAAINNMFAERYFFIAPSGFWLLSALVILAATFVMAVLPSFAPCTLLNASCASQVAPAGDSVAVLTDQLAFAGRQPRERSDVVVSNPRRLGAPGGFTRLSATFSRADPAITLCVAIASSVARYAAMLKANAGQPMVLRR